MTSWQDEPTRSPFGGGGADPSGRPPLSRRAAREAERRAAETMLEKPPHPSGVVDFEAHDFSAEFTPDQDIAVGDTQDIWAALTRGQAGGQGAAAPAQDPTGLPSMDRVREAVLRRRQQGADGQAGAARPPQQRPSAFDSQAFDPRLFDARPDDSERQDAGASRRERRRREVAEQREDGLPAELFAERGPQQPEWDEYAEYEQAHARGRQVPVEQYPGEQHPAEQYDDDDYYDEPYAPEPTIAIPVRASQQQPQAQARPGTDPVSLPQGFAEPTGDDRLTFSDALDAQVARSDAADLQDLHDDADAEPEFLEPADPWAAARPDRAAQPRPASGPVSFLEPQQQSAFGGAQVGPPSELTDLAGFEALIRKARQQPPAPQPKAAPQEQSRAGYAWADDEDVQEGFGSLLGRQVQSSHGTSPALILPNDPQPVDLTQAVNGTGDIFTTGTMRFSNRFASTGASEEHYDSHEIDRLYDASQEEMTAGVEPKRASRAVSGASQNRVVTGKPGRGNLLPTVLAIVAGAMAVGVVTLLVGSWVFKIF